MHEYYSEVSAIRRASTDFLLTKPNVVGVAMGAKVTNGEVTDIPSVVVLVEKKLTPPELNEGDLIPRTIGEVDTDVVEVGKLVALRTTMHRPAPGGVSIGHVDITAGTLGVVATDNLTNNRVILSNNHVLANSNDAKLGDAILQQGPYDGGRPATHTIGHLHRFKEIDFGEVPSECDVAETVAKALNYGAKVIKSKHRLKTFQANPQAVNYIDAAIAEPINDDVISDEILDIGLINGTVDAYLGMDVRKSGRTTGYTHGTVMLIEATVNVGYGGSKIARFDNQIITDYMSAGGDSGSLGVAEDSNRAFGLLYAGSDAVTIYNPITDVLNTLMISL
jgi:hypothetical protein